MSTHWNDEQPALETTPSIKPLWDITIPYGHEDSVVVDFGLWEQSLLALTQDICIHIDPETGKLGEGNLEVCPNDFESKELKSLVVGDNGKGYCWARVGDEETEGERDATVGGMLMDDPSLDIYKLRQYDPGDAEAEWILMEFDIKTVNAIRFIDSPTGSDGHGRMDIGRKGRHITCKDFCYDYSTDSWAKKQLDATEDEQSSMITKTGLTFHHERDGWLSLRQDSALPRFAQIPGDVFIIDPKTDILFAGFKKRRVVAWRCADIINSALKNK